MTHEINRFLSPRVQAKAEKEAKSKAVALATAKEVDELVALLRKTVDEAEASMQSSMHDAAEIMFKLVDKHGLRQLKIATLMSRSQPWVSGLLKWKADGYPTTAFGPQAKKARAIRDQRLLVTNNPDPNVGMLTGPKLALLPDNRIVRADDVGTSNSVDVNASAEARKAWAADDDTPKPEPWSTDEASPVGKVAQKEFKDTPEALSKRTYFAGLSWLDDNLENMLPDARLAMFDHFKFHPMMVGVKRRPDQARVATAAVPHR